MNKTKYHITINSFYIVLDKVRYTGEKYSKYNVSYFYKTNDICFATERGVKINHSARKNWEIYESN